MDVVITGRRGPVSIVHLGRRYGSLEFDKLRDLQHLLLQLADETEPLGLLIDLQDTEYFGSGLMGILLQCYRQAKQHHARVGLCNVRLELREALEAMHLDSIMKIYDSRADAQQGLKRPDE